MGTRSLTNGKLSVTLQASITNTLLDSSVASQAIGGQIYSKTITGGVDANQANRGWQVVSRTLASGADETLDLYDFLGIDIGAGEGKDGLGQACAFEEIVAIAIIHVSGAGRLEINKSLPHDPVTWIGTHTVANGGALKAGGIRLYAEMDTDALDIQDGVSNKIKLTATGGAVVYSVYLLAKHDDDESSSSNLSSSSVSSLSSSESSVSSSQTNSTSSQSRSASSVSSASSQSSLSSSSSDLSASSASSASSTG